MVRYYSHRQDKHASINKWFMKMLTWCTYQVHSPSWELRERTALPTHRSAQRPSATSSTRLTSIPLRRSISNSNHSSTSSPQNSYRSHPFNRSPTRNQTSSSTSSRKNDYPRPPITRSATRNQISSSTRNQSSTSSARSISIPLNSRSSNSHSSNSSALTLRPSPTLSTLRPSPTLSTLRPRPTLSILRPSPTLSTLRPRPSRFSDATLPNTISNEEMTSTPADWDSTLWRPLDEDNRRAVIRLITEEGDSIGNNVATEDILEDDWNIDGNDNLGVNSGIFIANSDSDKGGNLGFPALENVPNQYAMETLLNDPTILTDQRLQPIRYNLTKLKELADNRKSRSLGSKVRRCPICLQDFQQLKRHQDNPNGDQGCYNVARIRDYILWKRGIEFQRSSNSSAVTLYDDFPSLEKTVLALKRFTL